MKYAWIREHRDSFPIAVLCEVLEVSASGYYAWLDRPPSPRAQRHVQIQQAVQQVHADSYGNYGSYKVARQLAQRPELESACRNTVAKAMRELGLKSRISRAFTPTTTQADPAKQPAPNQLAQDFTATAPNRKWVTDITYLPTAEGWVYLAVVLDLFSRKVVGWALSNSLATELVSAALRQAVESRRPVGQHLLHHSDRGCQYTSDAYQQTLRTLGIQCSMSRTGCCYDNAVMERFFWSLKHEWTNHEIFPNLEEARLSVFRYIETFYNPQRLHQTLGYLSPNQFEAVHAPATAA
ncbi:MAG: IS3 family transposase [Rhizobiales bacterium]|nr:IS3 family transposase [Hyphomicrobiales bacterium]